MGIRTPNVPPGSTISEFLGHEIVGNTRSLKRFPRSTVLGSLEAIASGLQTGGGVVFVTKAQADANRAYDVFQLALVTSDPAAEKNGLYQKIGAEGTGSWNRVADLPNEVIRLTVTGGTGNAITATMSPQMPSDPSTKLYLMVPAANNTDAVTINGIAVKNALGATLVGNSLVNGSPVLMIWAADHYQLLVSLPADTAGVVADALAASGAAAAAAAAAAASASALGNQVHQYDTLALAIAATIPAGVNMVRTLGRGAVNDRAPASWTRLGGAPGVTRSWHFQNTVDSSWWVMTVGWLLSPAMFGTTASNTAIQDALDYLKEFGLTGGRVLCEPNKVYTGTAAPVVWNGLTLDGNGSKIESTLSGSNTYGLRVGDNAEFRNGWAHSIDGGITSSQLIFGSGISIGVANGTPGNLIETPDYFASGKPRLRHVKATSTRARCPAVSVMGDIDCDFDGIEIPDDANCGGVHLDHSDIGGVTVAPGSGPGGSYVNDLERISAWRAAFDARTMIVTHPRGRIRGVRAGKLTVASSGDQGARLIRVSAVRDLIVEGCSIKESGHHAIEHVGGDFGFEFATPEVKRRAYKGIRFRNISADLCHKFGLFVDTDGDNVRNAVALGYVPLLPPIAHADIIAEGLQLTGPFDSSASDGIRIMRAKGVKVYNPTVTGFAAGTSIEDDTEDCGVYGGRIFGNRSDGATTKDVSTIKRITFEGVDSFGNGTAITEGAAFRIDGGSDIAIDRCLMGADTETTQKYGVKALASANMVRLSVLDNTIRGVKSGGTALQLAGSTSGDAIWLCRGNKYLGAETYLNGVSIMAVERAPRPSGGTFSKFIADRGAMISGLTPSFGTYAEGDDISIVNALSGNPAIVRKGPSAWHAIATVP